MAPTAHPVGVGIVGQHQVGAHLLRQGEGQVHGAGLLRVGEGDGGEEGVGGGLLGHGVDVRESGVAQHCQRRFMAHPVQGGVHNAQFAVRERVTGRPRR